MRPVRALYENGLLKPAKPLPLRAGESVAIVVMRQPDPARWQLDRLGSRPDEDDELAAAGLSDWATALEHEDHG